MVLEIIVEDRLLISTKKLQSLNLTAYKTLQQIFTYKNPKFIENEKWGYSNFNTPKYLYSYEIKEGNLAISRGGLDKTVAQLKKFGIVPKIIDRTLVCESVDFSESKTVLRPDQDEAMKIMETFDHGSLIAYTSFGKTPFLLDLARRIGQPTLVIVHTTFLQEHWIKEATNPKLLNISPDDIGGVGGKFSGNKRRFRKLNICLYHSLCNEEHLNFFKNRTGLVLFDEGQKTPIEGVQGVVNNFRARYRFTASADLKRKDGKEFLTFDTFGPIRHVVVEKNSDSKILSKIFLVPSEYEDKDYAIDNNYTDMISRMGRDKERNILICKRTVRKVKQGKLVLIFVERKDQAARLYKMLSKFKVDMLLGATNWKDYSYKHVKAQYDKKDIPIPESKLQMLKSVSKEVLEILKNYDDKTAYERISNKAKFKEGIDIIIGTQKSEVGLSIRTIDHGIVTTPAGNNSERFKQMKGRVERTYSEEQEEYFGHKKPVPTLDVIVDKPMSVSLNAAYKIKENYKKDTTVIRRKK